MDGPTRRDVLRMGAAGVLAGLAGLPLLEACTTESGGHPQVLTQLGKVLPAYVPFTGETPDLPGTASGVERAYFSYPRRPVRTVTRPFGDGGAVTALAGTALPPPAPLDQNPAWQAANARMGVSFRPNITSINDYSTKFNTVVASGDIPDLMRVQIGYALPSHFIELLQARFTDLTPYLAGDAIKAYPNLANIPPISWPNAVFNGALWAVPIAQAPLASCIFARQDMLDAGDLPQPANTDDFARILNQLTRPQENRWGITALRFGVNVIAPLFGVANDSWRLQSGGKLVYSLETPEYREMVAFVRSLFAAGVYHPATQSLGRTQGKTLFVGGQVAMVVDGFTAWGDYFDQLARQDPGASVRLLRPFGHGGRKPIYALGSGALSPVLIRKTTPARVRELLHVLDFIAAPFGSEEYLLTHYGVEGVDFTLDGSGNPISTARGVQDAVNFPWGYVAAGPSVLYHPTSVEFVKMAHAAEQELVALGTVDPTRGLYSPAQIAKSPVLGQPFSDRVTDIITGRTPMSAYDQLVSDWRAQGGDQVRRELEQALQKSKN